MHVYLWEIAHNIIHVNTIKHTCMFVIMYIHMYLSFAKVEFGISAEATLEHLKWEDLILVQERTNAGGWHIFCVAMVNKINFDLQ